MAALCSDVWGEVAQFLVPTTWQQKILMLVSHTVKEGVIFQNGGAPMPFVQWDTESLKRRQPKKLTLLFRGAGGADEEFGNLLQFGDSVESVRVGKPVPAQIAVGIRQLRNLKEVNLSDTGVNNEFLSVLCTAHAPSCPLPPIETIHLCRCPITDQCFEYLAVFQKSLTSLDVSYCDKIKMDWTPSLFPNLKQLSCKQWKWLSDSFFRTLHCFPQLQVLELNRSSFPDDGIALISGLVNLRELVIEIAHLRHSPIDFEDLTGIVNIEKLTLCGKVNGFTHLRHMPKLEELKFSLCDPMLSNEQLGQFHTNHPVLRSLTLSTSTLIGDAGIRGLAKCANLERLTLDGLEGLTDGGLEIISTHLLRLRKLHVGNNRKVTDAGARFLSQLAVLESLGIANCSQITGRVFEFVQLLPNLREITFQYCRIGGDHLTWLPSIKKLRMLYLGSNELSDANLELIARATALEGLYLQQCFSISDKGIKSLLNLRNLQRMGLLDCPKVSPDGIRQLAVLPQLRDCHVFDTKGNAVDAMGMIHQARERKDFKYI